MKGAYVQSKGKKRCEQYRRKAYQSFVWRNQHVETHLSLKRTNTPEEVVGVIAVMEQMVETTYHIAETGRHVDSVICWIYGQYQETVLHWLAGSCKLAAHEYLTGHD